MNAPWQLKQSPQPPPPAAVIRVLDEIERGGFVSDGDPITLTEAFKAADLLGFLSCGGGFSTRYSVNARGRKALDGVSKHWLAFKTGA